MATEQKAFAAARRLPAMIGRGPSAPNYLAVLSFPSEMDYEAWKADWSEALVGLRFDVLHHVVEVFELTITMFVVVVWAERDSHSAAVKDCYTCDHSPAYWEGARAGCSKLTMDEEVDAPIIAFCEASGANDEPNLGWPSGMNVTDCPAWTERAEETGIDDANLADGLDPDHDFYNAEDYGLDSGGREL